MSAWRDHLLLHRQLVADRVRVERYRRAIDATVRAGDVVLDIGTGTGILAVLACRAGAQRVYAVENTDMIDVARDVCASNGVRDRVVFVWNLAEHAELPERVDVVITETLGSFGIDEGIVGLAADARARQLKPGGRIVPRGIDLVAVPLEVPDVYARTVETWGQATQGVDFSEVRRLAANTIHAATLDVDGFLAAPARLAHVALVDAVETDVHAEAGWTVARAGTLHGIGGWFSAELAPDVVVSNAPPLATPGWAQAFLPLEHPARIDRGDEIRLTLSARANGGVWYWHVTVAEREVAGQSTLWGTPRLEDYVRRGAPDHSPTLTAVGRAHLDALGRMNGLTSNRELCEALHAAHPDLFRSASAAEAFVREIAARSAD